MNWNFFNLMVLDRQDLIVLLLCFFGSWAVIGLIWMMRRMMVFDLHYVKARHIIFGGPIVWLIELYIVFYNWAFIRNGRYDKKIE